MRGEIRKLEIAVPRHHDTDPVGEVKEKWCVCLVGDDRRYDHRVTVVLCGKDDRPDDAPYDFEVKIPQGGVFTHPTVIDGRWVFTISREMFTRGEPKAFLDSDVMDAVADAVAAGLGLI